MTDLAIRSATLNDLPAIQALERQALTAAHWTLPQYEKLLSHGIVLIAEQGGHLCGFLCAQKVGAEWEIENVVVAAEFKRRGIANALVRALIERATNQKAQSVLIEVHLEVRESNAPARRLYEKHGFREVGCRRGYYSSPLEDAILYALQLND
jgi:[ribosomal protein S18]-alanine N-acetyltransferase